MVKGFRDKVEGIMKGDEGGGLLPFFLSLISFFYGLFQRIRVWLYEKGLMARKRLNCRVISVGNITVGGTGKTPSVIAIAKAGVKKGLKVAILTRGYKGRVKGVSLVSDGLNILLDCKDAGDESYLMAKKLTGIPIIKGKDRYISGQLGMERFSPEIFILDDGFQHLKLHRDIDILLIDCLNPFGNGYIFPRGILREPLDALKRADLVVLTKVDDTKKREWIMDKVRQYNHSAQIFFGYYRPLDLISTKGDIMTVGNIIGKGLFIFSGLANPSSFRLILERVGATIIGELTYPDHFYYSKKDIDEIKEKAGALMADFIVTTEKDIVRVNAHGLKTEIWALRIEFVIEDEEIWERLLFGD